MPPSPPGPLRGRGAEERRIQCACKGSDETVTDDAGSFGVGRTVRDQFVRDGRQGFEPERRYDDFAQRRVGFGDGVAFDDPRCRGVCVDDREAQCMAAWFRSRSSFLSATERNRSGWMINGPTSSGARIPGELTVVIPVMMFISQRVSPCGSCRPRRRVRTSGSTAPQKGGVSVTPARWA